MLSAQRATPQNTRGEIIDSVSNIKPLDSLEQQHKDDVLSWLRSNQPIYRISKPDNPKKHLVSYFVVFDKANQKILLVDHKNAKLWLPSGGHVEIDEHPAETVRRECKEELNISASFLDESPMFLTQTKTVGLTAGHVDVSLWYVINGDSDENYQFDTSEFESVAWFTLDQIPFERSDPHMQRFVRKLKATYG